MLMRGPMIEVPEDLIEEKFLAGTGPGGQNVNKVATACQLRVNVYRLGLAPDVFRRLRTLAGSKMTDGGELLIQAKRHRTREANREDARARLNELIAAAHVRPERRIKTKVSKAAKARRVDAKKGRSAVKSLRGRVRAD